MLKIIQLSLLSILLFTACEERAKPVPNFSVPIACMQLNTLGVDKILTDRLKQLYAFNETCHLTLSISYKKDIVFDILPIAKARGF